MNFDDPLADLLSDNSADNDSFFDNPTGGANRKAGNKGKGKMEDLFGIKEETEPDFKVLPTRKPNSSSTLNVQSNKTPVTSTPRITKQKPSQSNDNDDDDLGFDPKKPKAAVKSNLFDDLLGAVETRRPTTAPMRREETVRPAMSRQSTDTTTENSNLLLSQTRPKTATGRRSSGASTVANTDPLGLFGGQTRERDYNMPASGMSTPQTKKRGTTADWLGLNVEPEETVHKRIEARPESPKTPSQKKQMPTVVHKENLDILKLPDNDDVESVADMPQEVITGNETAVKSAMPTANTEQNIMLLTSMNMESKNSYTVLQQQESQLSLAAQMKNQERTLLEMQKKQDALLEQQDRQFQALLQQQFQRHQEMEEHIKLQQQRINHHIQLMMTQPPPPMLAAISQRDLLSSGQENEMRDSEPVQQPAIEMVHIEAGVKRLELEKTRLEELVENMKTNYEREIEMIESSYKKQLLFLEEHLTVVETRFKSDVKELKQYYNQKLETSERDKEKLKSDLENEISTLKQDHEDELRKLRKAQEDDLEMVKEEHRRMLESIRQSKMLEFAAIQENGSYLETLKAASSNLENLSDGLEGLRDNMETKIEQINKEKEKKLEARERKLEDAEKRLQLTVETAEDEKCRLMKLVSTLELQLSELSKNSAEENWLMRQKMSSLDAEKSAFEREKEFTREQFARDEKRIADLKEMQLMESQRMMVEVQEERSHLLIERSKIETEKKLNRYNDGEKQQLEVETSLRVAQDAARQADAERERYTKLQRHLEKQKRELIDQENRLHAKEEELEREVLSFRLAERKSQQSLRQANDTEQNFQMKIQFLQRRMRELGEKEATLSQERLLLAQERIALHNHRKKLSDRKCVLCRMSEQSDEITQMLNVNDGGFGLEGGEDDVNAGGTNGDSLMRTQTNIVERMLDENIAESYRRMKLNANKADFWSESVMDDDTKELALHQLDSELKYGNYDLLNKNLASKYS